MKLTKWRWELVPAENRNFILAYHFVGWGAIQLGFHLDWRMMNIQIHIPFGFIHIGRHSRYVSSKQVKETIII